VSADVELLRSLCLAPGPTGFEAPAQEVVRRRLAPLEEVQADPLGPAGGPQVVVTAHADQIGLIVTYVDDHGYVFVEKIGGVAPLLVPGRHFVIHGAGGPVHAVGGKKPTHIIPADERDKAPALDEQFLDIGASNREAALERVAVGDPVTFTPEFIELSPGVFGAQALDDRAGVYCLVRALELYAAAPGAARLTGVSTVHEETTFMGAKARAKRLTPGVMIVVDGDFCSDTPAADAKKLAGEVKLGAGPVQQPAPPGECSRRGRRGGHPGAAQGRSRGDVHRRRRAHGRRRRCDALAEPPGPLHALSVRGRARRRPGGRGAPGRRPRAAGGRGRRGRVVRATHLRRPAAMSREAP
jgi:putative aminopeptidase FrvX